MIKEEWKDTLTQEGRKFVEEETDYDSLEELNLDPNSVCPYLDLGNEWIIEDVIPVVNGNVDRVFKRNFHSGGYDTYCYLKYFDEHRRDDIQYSDLCLQGIDYMRKRLKRTEEMNRAKRGEK